MISTFNITQKGEKHIREDLPCQDYSFSKRIILPDCEYVIAAIADGVGTCMFSHIAAKISVTTCINTISEKIEGACNDGEDDIVLSAIRNAYEKALRQIEITASEKGIPLNEMDTTLTCAVFDGKSLWYGHIGDDGIVALYNSGKYEMITVRHKGEEMNSVYPLREKHYWQIGKCSEMVTSFALMTDGILDCCVDSTAMNSRVYFPFLEPLLTSSPESEEEVELLKGDWDEFLQGKGDYKVNIRNHVSDDITLAAGINSSSVRDIGEVQFDADEWEWETIKRRKELKEKLYRTNSVSKPSSYMKEKTSCFTKGLRIVTGLLKRLVREVKVMFMK